MTLYRMIGGVNVAMTPDEEAAFEAARLPSIGKARAKAIEAIKAARIASERAGAASGAHTIVADVDTVARLQALIDAATPGQQIPVEMVDGSVVLLPAAGVTGLITAAKARMLAAGLVEATKIGEVNALATVAEVRAYDINAGWPA